MTRGDVLQALASFEACMELERNAGSPLLIRAMSHYGLCLAMVSDRLSEAREICEAAVDAAPGHVELYLNLGRVCMRQDDRAQAFQVFVRGLRISPRHPALVEALRQLGFRQRPIVAFLPRAHPVNQMLGTLRSALERSARPLRRRPASRRAQAA